MRTNSSFGRLVNGTVEHAPKTLVVTGEDGRVRIIPNPTAEDYLAAGYKCIVDHRLPPSEGFAIVADGWDDQVEEIVAVYRYEPVAAPEPTVRKWTPLTLKRGAVARGWWDQFRAILQSADGYEDFLMCQHVAEDDPMFTPIHAALCSVFGDEAVDGYLDGLPTED